MTRLRKALPLLTVCAALFAGLPLAAQTPPDCSFTFTFTTDATQASQSNLSGNTPCVNWRVTLSTTGTLTTTATFQTSPDNSTWTAVPNTVCSATVQPPCVLQGSNPITGTQGMLYAASYGSYVRIVTSSSGGTGTGTIRAYGAKGASASALPSGGGSGSGTVTNVSFTGGIISVANPTTAPALTVAGTSGGIPYFSSATTWASSGALTANGVVLGGGAGATPTVTAADSTTTHALFATAGAPAFRALASTDIPALAYVTSVGWTGGIVTVATGTTTPAFTITGTSGGIPYFSSASTWATSAALTAGQFVLGGGGGLAPTTSFSVVPLLNGGTGVDLSSAGGTVNISGTQLLHENATHVIASSALVTQDMPIAHITRTATISDFAPVVGDSGLILVINPATAIHLSRIFCAVQGITNVVVNLDKRTEGGIGTDSGAHLLGAGPTDLTAVAGGANTSTWNNTNCGGTSSCAVASHAPVVMTITSVSGTPTALNCSVDYTVD